MKFQTLRALIASEQLAALQIQDGTMCAPSDTPLYDDERQVNRAIALADLLLAKLGESETVVIDALDWQDVASGSPDIGKLCWAVAWDASNRCILAVLPVLSTQSGWQDCDGNAWCLDGPDIFVYWRPLHHHADPDLARESFTKFIRSC